jgi:hypothetical protein
MSGYSSSKRVQNDISACEENSDRRIPADKYYIVFIELVGTDSLTNTVKTFLKNRDEHRALAVYVYENQAHLLFSSVEEGDHYLRGSHHAICSEYASLVTLEHKCSSRVKIVELDSRTVILVYFQTKVFENAKKSAHLLSKNTITKKEINQLTFGEIIPLLKEKASVSWEKIAGGQRFGTFYKYLIGSDHREKFITLTGLIDMQDIERYTGYFFE